MQALGLGSIIPLAGVAPAEHPVLHGRLHAIGYGKDSTAGHWELMGVVQREQPPTYPRGFPLEVMTIVSEASGRQIICNLPYNGIGAIEDFGEEQLESGALIVYTSQDSVLQIAAHEDVIDAEELYSVCARVRAALPAEHAVRARDRAAVPRDARCVRQRPTAARTCRCRPRAAPIWRSCTTLGIPVHTVGKVGQLFARRRRRRPAPRARRTRPRFTRPAS